MAAFWAAISDVPPWRNGRRGRLKICCLTACWFESGRGHHSSLRSSWRPAGFFRLFVLACCASLGRTGPGATALGSFRDRVWVQIPLPAPKPLRAAINGTCRIEHGPDRILSDPLDVSLRQKSWLQSHEVPGIRPDFRGHRIVFIGDICIVVLRTPCIPTHQGGAE